MKKRSKVIQLINSDSRSEKPEATVMITQICIYFCNIDCLP